MNNPEIFLLFKLKPSNKLNLQPQPVYVQAKSNTIDWNLLFFLILFLNVKMAVKVIAILFIYISRLNFKFGFRKKYSRLPLFYLIVIGIGILNWVISNSITKLNYDIVLLTGIFFWSLCILAVHQLKLSVEQNDPAIIHQTITLFFIINAVISLATYLYIICKTGYLDPFTYQGEFQKYFINTGDYIKGISFDTSITNAVLSAFGVLYFLNRSKGFLCLLCMITMLLTGSNFINILLFTVFIYVFIFQSNKDQKSLLVVCLMLLLIFMAKVSPQNEKYITQWYNDFFYKNSKVVTAQQSVIKQSNVIHKTEKDLIAEYYLDSLDKIHKAQKQNAIIGKINPQYISTITAKPEIPQDDINSKPFQYKQDTTGTQRELLTFIDQHSSALTLSANNTAFQPKYPGKIIALQQTENYFKQRPQRILAGAGMGNFSSKLAFRATAMKVAGGYPEKYSYINNDFMLNHFDLYLYYFSRLDKLHSLTNSPNSVYDQLLSEYGILGIISFLIFYMGFFVKHIKILTYGIPVLLLMAGAFFVDYWFEQLSVIIIFELLLLLNIKETTINANR